MVTERAKAQGSQLAGWHLKTQRGQGACESSRRFSSYLEAPSPRLSVSLGREVVSEGLWPYYTAVQTRPALPQGERSLVLTLQGQRGSGQLGAEVLFLPRS